MDKNKYEFKDNYVVGYTKKQEPFYFDLEDFEYVYNHVWHIEKRGYCRSCNIYLHRLIYSKYYEIDDKIIDHINRNKNDNRKINLRFASSHENVVNRDVLKSNKSGFTGVSFNGYDSKGRKVWRAYIQINRQQINLGLFINKDEAIISRLRAEFEYFGDFAPQKKLFKKYNITT